MTTFLSSNRTETGAEKFEFPKYLTEEVEHLYVVYRPTTDDSAHSITVTSFRSPFKFSARKKAQVLFSVSLINRQPG